MPPVTQFSPAAIALNRFGLGARPDEAVPANPAQWLLDQFERYEALPAGFARLPQAIAAVRQYEELDRLEEEQRRAERMSSTAGMEAARPDDPRQVLYRNAIGARADAALGTEAPFVERLVHFWSNHFCVSADNRRVAAFVGEFERDAIRPHVLGRFEDMLLAVERHPAMLLYLNQAQSIGPNSMAAQRTAERNPGKRRGLNENLGREIMELHTLGVRSGYTQADVIEFARALTGWSADYRDADGNGDGGLFAFRPNQHEPGTRTVLGKTYAQQGEAQARAVLADLARAPATARHIATKLARHFAADTPPPSLVASLEDEFIRGGGDLPSLYRVLVRSPEAWAPAPAKFKSPWEWTISAMRALGKRESGSIGVAAMQVQLGQPVWRPGSPAGWDDTASTWAAPDALIRRVELASRLVAPLADRLDARDLGARILPASLSAATAQEVARSETAADALALLLVSPDFLRR